MEYFLLGDCCIAYRKDGKMKILRDTRIEPFSALNRKKLREFHKENSGKAPDQLFREVRMMANTKDGYPIGSIRGTGIADGISGQISLEKGDRILLFSDGFLDYMNTFPSRIDNFFSGERIEDEIDWMYTFLKNPGQLKKSPRPKKIDDCTLLLLER